MSKRLEIVIGAVALVALFAWFFASNTSLTSAPENTATSTPETAKTVENVTPTPTPATTKPAPKGTANTYKSLLTQSGSYQCDYDQVQSTGQSHNVIYIYGGKMRGEFRTTHADGSSDANLFVYDGHYLYQWKEGSPSGTKTVLTSLSQLPLVIPKDLTSGAIVGSNYESVGWLCHTWLTNKALLSPPSYVSF